MSRRRPGVWILIAAATASASAQTHWRETPAGGPSALAAPSIAYDPGLPGTWVAGRGPTEFEVWLFDGVVWVEYPSLPLDGVGDTVAFDTARNRLVLFRPGPAETWELDRGVWSLASTGSAPAPSDGATGMCYDPMRGVTVAVLPSGATWRWNGVQWSQLASRPTVGSGAPLAFDPVSNRLAQYGGYILGGDPMHPTEVYLDELWWFDGTTWVRDPIRGVPRASHGLAFHPGTLRLHVVGGTSRSSSATPNHWSFGAGGWRSEPSDPGLVVRNGRCVFDLARNRLVAIVNLLVTPSTPEVLELPVGAMTWQRFTTPWPSARRGMIGLAFDPVRDRLVLAGSGSTFDTWEWDGSRWSEANITQIAPRIGNSLTWHGSSGRCVMFGGGYSMTGFPPSSHDETWTWDGATWRLENPPVAPPPRSFHGAAEDPGRGVITIFGGWDGSRSLGDTWEWDGTTWQARVVPSPPAGYGIGMAYDPNVGAILAVVNGETWTWDGTTWTRLQISTPYLGPEQGVAFDRHRNRMVASGVSVSNRFETWEFDGTNWTRRLSSATTPLAGGRIEYDAARRQIVRIPSDRWNTSNSTWIYESQFPAALTSFGGACPTSLGSLPSLESSSAPWASDLFHATLGPVPAASAVIASIGFSDQTWSGLALPVSLAPIGAPCDVSCAVATTIPMPTVGAEARFDLAIPSTASWLGTRFFTQGFVLDPGANALGLATTNALAATIGAR